MRKAGAVTLTMLMAASASAQIIEPAAVTTVPTCRLVDLHAQSGSTPLLYVACPSSSVLLGAAQQYRTASNLANGSVVVVVRNGSRTRVLLVSPMADGGAHIDDVSRSLAKRAGGNHGIGPATVDLSRFPVTGSIAIPGAALDLLSLTAHAKTAATAAAPRSTPSPDATSGR